MLLKVIILLIVQPAWVHGKLSEPVVDILDEKGHACVSTSSFSFASFVDTELQQ